MAAVLVEGVDDAVVGELVRRVSLVASRRRALADAPRLLRLADPLQRQLWDILIDQVDQPVTTADLARRLGVSREHLSRQFGAGGAPNLKRVIDFLRVVAAAQLLRNPGYSVAQVAALLSFSSSSHLGSHGAPDRGNRGTGAGADPPEGTAEPVRAGAYAEPAVAPISVMARPRSGRSNLIRDCRVGPWRGLLAMTQWFRVLRLPPTLLCDYFHKL